MDEIVSGEDADGTRCDGHVVVGSAQRVVGREVNHLGIEGTESSQSSGRWV